MNPALPEIAAITSDPYFSLPISLGTALEVRRTTEDPEASLEQMARLVRAEPSLSARALASSAAYRRQGKAVADVKAATSSIGFQTVRSLATVTIVRRRKEMAPPPRPSKPLFASGNM